MIKSISIQNFRSIKDLVTLDFSKSNRKKGDLSNYISISNTEIANTSVIYGANASGKSNLLRAFKALEFLVLNSAKFAPEDKIAPFEPFRLAKGFDKKLVKIELEFFIDQIRYKYSLAFDENSIEQEKLLFFPMGREANLFNRVKGREIQFGEYFKGEKKSIERITLPNQLFLSKAAENNAESILPVFQFFKNKLRVYSFLNQYKETGLERFYAKRLADEPESPFAKKLNALICALDTGINSISAKETDWNSVKFPDKIPENIRKKIQEDFKYEIRTVHELFDENNKSSGIIDFDIDEESTGTRSLLSIGGIILDALEKGSVLIIDEFEKNLHPIITSYLIKLFNEKIFNPKNAQLIIATHDVTQLNEELFNRDQVWFIQKNEFGVTELIRCSDIKGLRLNAPLDKWYITGRLGGTAIINDTNFVVAMQEGIEE
ncbi:MAG: AAA family ATPase [Bacteroidota bacterium]